jgi:hypothetical protein
VTGGRCERKGKVFAHAVATEEGRLQVAGQDTAVFVDGKTTPLRGKGSSRSLELSRKSSRRKDELTRGIQGEQKPLSFSLQRVP